MMVHVKSKGTTRTGSTLMRLVLLEVLKGTDYQFDDNDSSRAGGSIGRGTKAVFTVRNPYDSLVSYIRVMNNFDEVPGMEVINSSAVSSAKTIASQYGRVSKMMEHPDKLILKYEKFHNNWYWLKSELERYFGIKIEEELWEKIKKENSKKSIREEQGKLGDFRDSNDRLVHGKHVLRGSNDWRSDLADVMDEVKPILDDYYMFWKGL